MAVFAERLTEALKARKMKQIELARILGSSNTLISNYMSGLREPRHDTMVQIADILDVSIDFLLGRTDNMQRQNISEVEEVLTRTIPIFAPISCGTGSYEDGQVLDYIGIPESRLRFGKRYFGQYAKGDSMIGAGIHDGDLLIFEEASWLDEGKIGCFCINEELAVCKRFTVGQDKAVYLMSANDKYPPIRIDQTSDCFRIVGKLVSIVRSVE